MLMSCGLLDSVCEFDSYHDSYNQLMTVDSLPMFFGYPGTTETPSPRLLRAWHFLFCAWSGDGRRHKVDSIGLVDRMCRQCCAGKPYNASDVSLSFRRHSQGFGFLPSYSPPQKTNSSNALRASAFCFHKIYHATLSLARG